MGGHERVNDGTEGHCFSFTLLCAIHQHSQHVLQLILRSIIQKAFTICFIHREPVQHTLLLIFFIYEILFSYTVCLLEDVAYFDSKG